MLEEFELDASERQWLLAIDKEPLTKDIADKRVPKQIRDALIEKKLVHWKAGYLDVALLQSTSRGEVAARRLRTATAA